MTEEIFITYKKEFEDYLGTKFISPLVIKKFISSFNSHADENPQSFIDFWNFIKKNKDHNLEVSIERLNKRIASKGKGYKTLIFISDWSHSYLGPGEILCLLLLGESYSGRKKYPDLLFKNSSKKIEVKSYGENFRVSEATTFFTDLGTIIQALIQGGFLTSLTDNNNNDLRKGLRHFCESFLCPRGYIELNSRIWKLESSSDDKIIFKSSPETSRIIANYSIVRNSLRNWLGRGLLSIKLAEIIDPRRTSKIEKKELYDYVANILGLGDLIPISLEQYFSFSGLDSIIIYEKKNKIEPYQIINYDDLKIFTLDRIAQAKISYKKKSLIVSRKKI